MSAAKDSPQVTTRMFSYMHYFKSIFFLTDMKFTVYMQLSTGEDDKEFVSTSEGKDNSADTVQAFIFQFI